MDKKEYLKEYNKIHHKEIRKRKTVWEQNKRNRETLYRLKDLHSQMTATLSHIKKLKDN